MLICSDLFCKKIETVFGDEEMSKAIINITNTKCCAFCKYWWDPTCKYIMPNINNQWYYETTAQCRCIKKGHDTFAHSNCSMYRLKIEI